MKRLYLLIVFISACSFCNGQDSLKNDAVKYYPVSQLKADFLIFRSILENAHPSVYRYILPGAMDKYFDAGMAKIDHPLTTIEFWQILENVLAKMGSGHTNVIPDTVFANKYKAASHSILPFNIYIHDNRVFVRSNIRKADTTFKAGDEILVINNEPVSAILEQFRGLVTGDGYSNSFKDYRLESSFTELYNLLHGDKYQFMIFFKQGDAVKKALVKAVQARKKDTVKTKKQYIALGPTVSYPAELPATAVLKISNFTYRYYSFTHDSLFSDINKKGIKNLVIDLRNNTGGATNVCRDLMAYFMKQKYSFHMGQEAVMNVDRFVYIARQISKEPGDLVMKQLQEEHHYFLDKNVSNGRYVPEKNPFKGNLYLLVNRGTYSAASLLAVAIKKQLDCTIIGEETGGGLAGCDGGQIVNIPLPNTHFGLVFPTLWTYSMSTDRNFGVGLKPDIELPITINNGKKDKTDPAYEILKGLLLPSVEKKAP
jgi:C-terminal processing protease CtpA/Prc